MKLFGVMKSVQEAQSGMVKNMILFYFIQNHLKILSAEKYGKVQNILADSEGLAAAIAGLWSNEDVYYRELVHPISHHTSSTRLEIDLKNLIRGKKPKRFDGPIVTRTPSISVVETNPVRGRQNWGRMGPLTRFGSLEYIITPDAEGTLSDETLRLAS